MCGAGDDFTFTGYLGDLKWIEKQMKEWYDIKTRGILGGGDRDNHEVTILNRSLRLSGGDAEFEAAMRGIEGTTEDQNGPSARLSTGSNPAAARFRTVRRRQSQFAEGFAKGEEPGPCLSRKGSESLEQRGALEQLDRNHEDPRPPQMVDEAIK